MPDLHEEDVGILFDFKDAVDVIRYGYSQNITNPMYMIPKDLDTARRYLEWLYNLE
jgi:hypothetical protein